MLDAANVAGGMAPCVDLRPKCGAVARREEVVGSVPVHALLPILPLPDLGQPSKGAAGPVSQQRRKVRGGGAVETAACAHNAQGFLSAV